MAMAGQTFWNLTRAAPLKCTHIGRLVARPSFKNNPRFGLELTLLALPSKLRISMAMALATY